MTLSKNFELFLDPKDLYGPSYYVMYDKEAAFYHYEEELKADVLQYLERGSVFFDVGANIGLISFFVTKFYPESMIYAFEPGRVVNMCLNKTVEANDLKKIQVIKKGVSNRMGSVEFFIDPNSTGGSSLIRKNADKGLKALVEKIDLISLDEFYAENNVVPGLVKVDVEGAEELVIEGARNLIKSHRPVFIIESDNKKMLERLALWSEIFSGYSFRPVGEKEFFPISSLEARLKEYLSQGSKGCDYLFVPNT